MATQGLAKWSTTAATNASADPAVNFAEGMAPSAVNDSARGMMASVAKWRDDLYGVTAGLTTGGTSTAYTVTTNSTFAAAADMDGVVFTIIPNATSGAAPTLAVDGLTARALNFSTGVAIPTGALISGTPYLVRYTHGTTEFIVLGMASKHPLSALDIISGTSEATIAVDDTLPLYDLSATANRRMLVSDVLKVVNALTEDSSPDAALDYVMSYDTSATAAKKVLLRNLPGRLPRGYIDGCTLSNNSTNALNIAEGACRDSTNTVDMIGAAVSGKLLESNWAPGAGAGMRYSGASVGNVTYHIYRAAKEDGTLDVYAYPATAGADADSSAFIETVLAALQAETGGASFIYARRIGSILRESAAIVPFVQDGDHFRRVALHSDAANNPGTSAVTRTLAVPVGIRVKADFLGGIQDTGGVASTYVLFTSLDETDEACSSAASSVSAAVSNIGWSPLLLRTDLSGQIRSRVNTSDSSTTTRWRVRGWYDQRGKDA